jgi:hypothetical protein
VYQLLKKYLNARAPRITRDVSAWVNRSPAKARMLSVFQTPIEVRRRLPQSVEPDIAAPFTAARNICTNELFVAEISHARVAGEQGLVILPDNSFAWDYLTHDERRIRESPFYHSRWQRGVRTVAVRGRFFAASGLWCCAYYHWMHDVLQRFWKFEEWLPGDARIIVPANAPAKGLTALEAIGIPPQRIARQPLNEVWRVEHLIFAPPMVPVSQDAPCCAGWLRESLVNGTSRQPDSTSRKPRRIYVSRRQAACRRILNEDSLLEVLSGYGFDSVVCETLSYHETAGLFAAADAVVAPHGAGLVNLIYARPGVKVLELFPPGGVNVCYWSLCEALGHQYAYAVGFPGAAGGGPDDFEVPIAKLLAGLKLLGL